MLVMTRQLIDNADKQYEMLDIDLNKELKGRAFVVKEEDFSDLLNQIKEDENNDCNRYGEEFSSILLNSNFRLNDLGFIEPSLCVDISDSKDNFELRDLNLEINALDIMAILSQTDGFIIFTHNSKKIVNNSNHDSTFYFKDSEPVFLNKIVAKPLSSMRIENNSLVVDYDMDGVPYFFEILNVSDSCIKLSDFEVQLSSEEFNLVKDKFDFDDLRETQEKVTFKLLNQNLGKVNYSVNDIFNAVASTLLVRKRLLKGIKESFNLFTNRKSVNTFLEHYKEESRLGINNSNSGIQWDASSCKSIFNLEYIEKHSADLDEFLAMLEISPYDDFFALGAKNNSVDKDLVKKCYSIFAKHKEIDLNKLNKEILLIDLYLTKLISEIIKTDIGSEVIWIPTDYGQEIITLKGGEEEDE